MSSIKIKFPHVFVLLFITILLAAVATWIIAPGQYRRIEDPSGRMIVDPESYRVLPPSPVGLWQFFAAIPKGMVEAGSIIFFVFVVGGAFSVVQATGMIDAYMARLTKLLQGRENLIIPVTMLVFSLCGAIGLRPELLPFVPVTVSLATAFGYDSITGMALFMVGTVAGFSTGFLNPFTVAVAQGIAGLPLFSGLALRILAWLSFTGLSTYFIHRYACKIKAQPESSPVFEEDTTRDRGYDWQQSSVLEAHHLQVFIVIVVTMGILVYAVLKWFWDIDQIAGLFLFMGIAAGCVGKLSSHQIAEAFVDGSKQLICGAFVIGLAWAIMVVLEEGNISDTIIHWLAGAIARLPSSLNALGMYVVQSLLNFIIPSGSGQAAVTMPILSPLADLVGVTRQTAVLAFQFGDGISNSFAPTDGSLMAGLALAGIPYDKWARWILPLLALQYLLGAVFIIIAQVINYGPY